MHGKIDLGVKRGVLGVSYRAMSHLHPNPIASLLEVIPSGFSNAKVLRRKSKYITPHYWKPHRSVGLIHELIFDAVNSCRRTLL